LWGDDDCRAHVYFFGGSLRRRQTPCETATRRWDNKRRGRHGELIWNGDLKRERSALEGLDAESGEVEEKWCFISFCEWSTDGTPGNSSVERRKKWVLWR
jgi:hypothetical protein